MAAPSKDFSSIADASIDPNSPGTTGLFTKIRDALENLNSQIIGETSPFVAAQKHDHDGVNSALIAGGFIFGDNAVDNTTRTTTSTSFVDLPGASITIPGSELVVDHLVHILWAINMNSTVPTTGDAELRMSVDGVIRGPVFLNATNTFIRFGASDTFLLLASTSPVIKLQFRQSAGQTATVNKSHLIVKLAE